MMNNNINTTTQGQQANSGAPVLTDLKRASFPRVLKIAAILATSLFTHSLCFADALEAEEVVNLEDISRGELLFKTPAGRFHPAVLLDTRVTFKITGLIARVQLTQTFHNDTNDTVEGIYAFPLPETAAVNKMSMRVGDRLIEGEIKEKSQAEKIYQQARSEGRHTSLVSQNRPNMFTNKIANISAGESVKVELTYIQKVSYKAGDFSIRFPLTITPRYIPGHTVRQETSTQEIYQLSSSHGWGSATDQVPDAANVTPYQLPHNALTKPTLSVMIEGEIDLGLPIYYINSDYHRISSSPINAEETQYRFSLLDAVPAQQDFVLHWRPEPDNQPRVGFFTERVDNENYGLLMILPPDPDPTQDKAELLSREVIYVIDTSGSMGGVSIKQAKRSLRLALDQLRPQDQFNIIEFNSTMRALYPHAVITNASAIQEAKNFVSRLQTSGGTEMYPALEFALKSATESQRVRQVIFITDGAVGNEDHLLTLIENNLGPSRLFTIGIGSAPNSYFMREAAASGKGSYTYIGSNQEVAGKMSLLFDKLTRPVVTNIQIDWQFEKPEAYPFQVPDLYRNEPIWTSVKFNGEPGHEVSITGRTADRPWHQSLLIEKPETHNGIATLWARAKIASLLEEKRRGADEQDSRGQILKVALTHHLLSPYTSFIAVESQVQPGKQTDLKTHGIPNLLPLGQSAQKFVFPATASGLGSHLLYALMLSIFGLLLLGWRRFITPRA